MSVQPDRTDSRGTGLLRLDLAQNWQEEVVLGAEREQGGVRPACGHRFLTIHQVRFLGSTSAVSQTVRDQVVNALE